MPLGDWMHGELHDFLRDTADDATRRGSVRTSTRGSTSSALISREGKFSRNLWALLSLELWQQEFHDRASEWRFQEDTAAVVAT